ncbi:melanoma-associated antigen 10-like isoform X3 [Lutra lutra]|uniref:melanoma-associated antigen 10-like isoform X3 n=1 Tax=Lutra lutra TaxID=9657 RepID=UPI001FCFF0A8|nr:melanoma-associated antigen 10-like isoform X3 [Lutra lutra]
MPVGGRNELRKLEEAPQDPREAQRLADAQLYEASGFAEALSLSSSPSSTSSSPSSSSSFSSFFSSCSSHLSSTSSSSSSSYFVLFPNTPEEESASGGPSPPQSPQRAFPNPSAMAASPWSLSEDSSSSAMEEGSGTGGEPGVAESVHHAALHVRAVSLVGFLLQKFCTKQPTSQAEMLAIVGEDEQDAFPGILGQASECMRLVFGVEVKEVDPSEHSYVLVPVLGLTCDAMLSAFVLTQFKSYEFCQFCHFLETGGPAVSLFGLQFKITTHLEGWIEKSKETRSDVMGPGTREIKGKFVLASDAFLSIIVYMPEAHTRGLLPWLGSSRMEEKCPLSTEGALLAGSLIARHTLSSPFWKALWMSREDTRRSRTRRSHRSLCRAAPVLVGSWGGVP